VAAFEPVLAISGRESTNCDVLSPVRPLSCYRIVTFEEFSAGYSVGRLSVEPSDGEHAAMGREQHEEANEQVHATGEGVGRVATRSP